ncbi:helix-turn-helix domain-containing protein, partial [Agathobaculum ammoniilyticum]
KIFHTTPKSLRGRLLSYLSAQAVQNGCDTFDIPFDRQQLADYLGADRSALSNELSKMQRDGLLSFRKNHFVLHRK